MGFQAVVHLHAELSSILDLKKVFDKDREEEE
jgi:hypothetical protein